MKNSPTLAVLYIAAFCSHIVIGFLILLIPYYADDPQIGASGSQIGLIVGTFSLGTGMALVPSGFLSDKLGRRTALIPALVLFSLTPLLYPMAGNAGQLVAIRIVHGITFGAFLPAASASLIDLTSQGKRGRSLGVFGAAAVLGIALGPLLGSVLLDTFGFTGVFYICSLISGLGLMSILMRAGALPQRPANVDASSDYSWAWAKSHIGIAALLIPILITFGSGTIVSYVPSYVENFGIGEWEVGIIFTVMYLGSALSRVMAGWVSDTVGRRPVILLGFVFSVISLACISFSSQSVLWLGLAALLFGMGMGAAMTSGVTLLADVSPSRMRGITMGMHNTSLNAGLFIGPVIMGLLVHPCGYETMFRVCAMSLAGGLILVFTLLCWRYDDDQA